MRRLWATGLAIVTSLALGVLPALAQEETATDKATAAGAAPFHAVPEGSEVVWGEAWCQISLSGGDTTEGAEGWYVLCTLDMSDPRVSGIEKQDRFHLLVGSIGVGAVWMGEDAHLTNDEGTWSGSVVGVEGRDTLPSGEAHYVGEGGYEGLVFHYYFSTSEDASHAVVRGWISPISEPPAE
jgi:hypothetical protein